MSRKEREQRLKNLFEEFVPFNRLLGLKVESFDPKAPKLRFDMKPELIGNPTRGILHGGVISAALDVMAGFSIHAAMLDRDNAENPDGFPKMGTIDLRIDYLLPGRGKYFIASAKVARLGTRVAVTHMALENDEGEQIATGSAAYMIG
jgi:uncharacterized protein (TIGR00369 family)